jgi:signal peptidase
MKQFLNKFFNILLNILIVFVVICLGIAFYSFIQVKVLNNGYANYFGYTYFHTISGSMEDSINIDDFVFVKITDNIEVDDIISFKSDNMIVTHRVIEIDEEKIITKGDANNVSDNPITKKQIVGKVVYVGRNYGKFYKLISEPIVFISFFTTVVLFSLVFSDEKERSVKDEKKS